MSTLPIPSSIGENLRTQDNRITAEPIFLVQQKVRQTGIDNDYADHALWLDEDWNEIEDKDEIARLETEWQDTFEAPEGFTRTGYVDRWDFLQPFFTEAAAKRFIEGNAHRYDELRIYVDSAYRNVEWQAIRAFLLTQ